MVDEATTEKRSHKKKAPALPEVVGDANATPSPVTFAEQLPTRQTVRFIRGVHLNPQMSRAVESYTGDIVETGRGVLLVEHQARVPWSNIAVIHPPGLTEAEIRRGPSTADEERGLKDRMR